MRIYDGHLLYFREQPFMTIVDPDINGVKQFVNEYCASNNIQVNADDWVIVPIKSIISKQIQDPAVQVGQGRSPSKYVAVSGDVPITINRRCFE